MVVRMVIIIVMGIVLELAIVTAWSASVFTNVRTDNLYRSDTDAVIGRVKLLLPEVLVLVLLMLLLLLLPLALLLLLFFKLLLLSTNIPDHDPAPTSGLKFRSGFTGSGSEPQESMVC